MSLPRLRRGTGRSVTPFSSFNRLGVSLGMALLVGSSGAIALPTVARTVRPLQVHPLQVAQSTAPDSGDVIVNTEPQRPGSTTTPGSSSTTTTTAGNRFTCEMASGQYTVMYHPESQPSQNYPWAVPSNMGGGWDANRRCTEISRRLELYRPDGALGNEDGCREWLQHGLCHN